MPRQPLWLRCDERQIGQVLTNLLQNAIQSIRAREAPAVGELERGRIETRAVAIDNQVVLEVLDNGRGLPSAERDRLFEPYITTRAKGAGLGLAIVKKIAEDHGAHLTLGDRPEGGACARIVFPADSSEAEGGEAERADRLPEPTPDQPAPDEPRMVARGA